MFGEGCTHSATHSQFYYLELLLYYLKVHCRNAVCGLMYEDVWCV